MKLGVRRPLGIENMTCIEIRKRRNYQRCNGGHAQQNLTDLCVHKKSLPANAKQRTWCIFRQNLPPLKVYHDVFGFW